MGGVGVGGDGEIQTMSSHVIFKKANCHSPPRVSSDLSPDLGEGHAGGWNQLFLFVMLHLERNNVRFLMALGSHSLQGPTGGMGRAQDNSLCVYWELKMGPKGPLHLDSLEVPFTHCLSPPYQIHLHSPESPAQSPD